MTAMNEAGGLDIARVSEGDQMLEEMRATSRQLWELRQATSLGVRFDQSGAPAHDELGLAYQLGALLKLGGELAIKQGLEEPGSEKLLAEENDAAVRRAILAYNEYSPRTSYNKHVDRIRTEWFDRVGVNWVGRDVLMWKTGQCAARMNVDEDAQSAPWTPLPLMSYNAIVGTIININLNDYGTVILNGSELREYTREDKDAEWLFDEERTKQFSETRVSRMMIPVTGESGLRGADTDEFVPTVKVLPVADRRAVTTVHPTHL